MPTIRIPIVEGRGGNQSKLFHKLPNNAKKLFVMIAKATKASDSSISLNVIRNTGLFGNTSDIEQLLYALESRGFGKVKVIGAEMHFMGNKTLMQSVL